MTDNSSDKLSTEVQKSDGNAETQPSSPHTIQECFVTGQQKKSANANWTPDIPLVLNVLVDHASNAHGHNSVVPGGDEHESQTHTHAKEGQSPVGVTHKGLS